MPPRTQYAKSGEISIAYQVLGNGPVDLVYAQGWLSHIELAWENPDYARFLTRLGSFARLIRFDRRGMGLSDRDVGSSTLEERVDDIRAVMDAVDSSRAAILAVSEAGYMATMFAATHPERTSSLILCGSFAKGCAAHDYPWTMTMEEREAESDALQASWSEPFNLDEAAPSVAHDQACREWLGAYLRSAASPGAVRSLNRLIAEMDVRSILPTIRVPTLVLHRTGDRWINVAEGRYLAEHIPGARFVELPGDDHIPWWGEQDRLMGEIQEFVTGVRTGAPTERVLLTVLVTDIVGSTERAAAVGDRKWKDQLQAHDAAVRRQLRNFEGQEINTTGDGFILSFMGPTRAIQCAQSIIRELQHLGISVRIGLHTGECERRGKDISGLALHIASRIVDKSSPQHILVSSTVKELVVGSGINFSMEGTHSLKGVPGEWPLYGVVNS
jgi:pimeloyl-ACP methyl ester carboxylesterase